MPFFVIFCLGMRFANSVSVELEQRVHMLEGNSTSQGKIMPTPIQNINMEAN